MDQLWIEQYRPKHLTALDHNPQVTEILTKLAQAEDFPHLLFYGPNGAGKKTRVMAFLREVFGQSVYSVQRGTKLPIIRQEEREFKISDTSSTSVTCNILTSKYHLDVTPSDCDHHDRVIIQKLIKETASSHQVNSKNQKDFKVIVLNEVDNLTHEAQASLRRTMEKYVEKCRLILVCEQLSKVIEPIRSRCLLIRCPAASPNEIMTVLQNVASSQKMGLPAKLADRIANSCDGNLREALLCLQSAKVENRQLTDDTKLHPQEWKEFINKRIADTIVKTQTPEALKEIRDRFYELLVNCIPADRIIRVLLDSLLPISRPTTHHELIFHAADCDNKLKYSLIFTSRLGQNAIFHLEAFAARCMVVIKKSN